MIDAAIEAVAILFCRVSGFIDGGFFSSQLKGFPGYRQELSLFDVIGIGRAPPL